MHVPWSITLWVQSRTDKRSTLSDYIEDSNTRAFPFFGGAVVHGPGDDEGDGGEEATNSRVDADIPDESMNRRWHVGMEVACGCYRKVCHGGDDGMRNQVGTSSAIAVGERRGEQNNHESEQIWRSRKSLRGNRRVTHTASQRLVFDGCIKVALRVTYSLIMVGKNTGMELKATLQLKNMNCTSQVNKVLTSRVVWKKAYSCEI